MSESAGVCTCMCFAFAWKNMLSTVKPVALPAEQPLPPLPLHHDAALVSAAATLVQSGAF